MKNKFTPGPWQVGEIVRGPRETDPRSGGRGICRLYSETRKALRAEQVANARLIAAGPCLLEALEYLLSRCDRTVHLNGDTKEPREVARAAIAKARGES